MDKYRPKTQNHQDYWDDMSNRKLNYVACTGPSGTAKTILACKYAAQSINQGDYDKLYIITPMVEVDDYSMGFLPGGVEEKTSPHLQRITQHLKRFSHSDHQIPIEPLALSLIRGRNLEGIILLDEAQNCTLNELKAVFTRLTNNSKLIISGDFAQNDMKFRYKSDLEKCLDAMEGYRAFSWTKMTDDDIVRSKHISEILRRFDQINP